MAVTSAQWWVVAQAAFGPGNDDEGIVTVDIDGVALVAIQGLHEMVREKDREIAALASSVADHKRELAELRRWVDALITCTAANARSVQLHSVSY